MKIAAYTGCCNTSLLQKKATTCICKSSSFISERRTPTYYMFFSFLLKRQVVWPRNRLDHMAGCFSTTRMLVFYHSSVEHDQACFTEQMIILACNEQKYIFFFLNEELKKYTKIALLLYVMCEKEFLLFQVNQVFIAVYLYRIIISWRVTHVITRFILKALLLEAFSVRSIYLNLIQLLQNFR